MDATALFKQYEADYCGKSTDCSRKIATIETLNGGEHRTLDTRQRARWRGVLQDQGITAEEMPFCAQMHGGGSCKRWRPT